MAFNREWDRGKYPVDDASSWQYQTSGTSNVHPRDDEYYGEGKRRKYNHGVSFFIECYRLWFNLLQGYDAPFAHEQGYDDNAYDYGAGRQADYAPDYSSDERYPRGGGHNKKRLVPSDPSPHVIFLGLDPDFTEADVRNSSTSTCITTFLIA